MRSVNLSVATWRKSSYSNQDGGACVEVSDDFQDIVPVRDSKSPDGPVLAFGAENWATFVSGLKSEHLGA